MMMQSLEWNPRILSDCGVNEEMIENLGVELSAFMKPFQSCTTYTGQEIYAEVFIKGFLSDLQYKSAEPIALRYGTSVRGTQRFLSSGKWDTDTVGKIYRAELSKTIASPTGMITIDESGEPKKGTQSAGVARQYCGNLGKTDNSQVGVFIGYCNEDGAYGIIDRKLYMPEKWFDDDYASLRKECKIPEDASFQTKPEIATALLASVTESGLFSARWVGVDSLYGRNKAFLASVPEGLWYFADIPSNTQIFMEKPRMVVPEYSGIGRKPSKKQPSIRPISVSDIADNSSIPWNKVVLGEGAKGPITANEKCLRVIMCDEQTAGDCVWLYIRQLEDGTCKYSISNAPHDISLDVIRSAALMRWSIEQCFLECKCELGLDHCEARSWIAWHRHTLLVLLAHLFLTQLRLKYKKNFRY